MLRQACGRHRAQGRPRQGQAEPSGKALATETVSRPQQAQGLEVKARGGGPGTPADLTVVTAQ